MDSDPYQPHTLCPRCNEFIRTQNYIIHQARCKGPSMSQSRASSRMPNNSRPGTTQTRQSIFRSRPQDEQRIPCHFCGYGQTLAQLDTHPNACQHREQQCSRCKNRFPRSLMQQHTMVCPANRQPQYEEQSRQRPNRPPYYEQQPQFQPNEGLPRRPYPPQQYPEEYNQNYQNYPPQNARRREDPLGFINMMMQQMMGPMQQMQRQPRQQPEGRSIIRFSDLGALIQFLAGQGMHQEQVGLSKQDINKFPVKKYDSKSKKTEDQDKCIICYCNFQDGEDCMTLPCKHIFHPQCVGTWLQKNPTCPVCKHNFGPPKEEQQGSGQHSHGPHVRMIRFRFP